MGRLRWVIAKVVWLALLTLLIWPMYALSEAMSSWVVVVFLSMVTFLVYFAVENPPKSPEYASVGSVLGMFIGGINVWALLRFFELDDRDIPGWELLNSIYNGLIGGFAGIIVGVVIGGVIDYLINRSARRTG